MATMLLALLAIKQVVQLSQINSINFSFHFYVVYENTFFITFWQLC